MLKLWEPFQPEAGCLAGVMPELMRLYDLVRLAPAAGQATNWVFNRNAGYVDIGQHHDEGDGVLSLLGAFWPPFVPV